MVSTGATTRDRISFILSYASRHLGGAGWGAPDACDADLRFRGDPPWEALAWVVLSGLTSVVEAVAALGDFKTVLLVSALVSPVTVDFSVLSVLSSRFTIFCLRGERLGVNRTVGEELGSLLGWNRVTEGWYGLGRPIKPCGDSEAFRFADITLRICDFSWPCLKQRITLVDQWESPCECRL